jgi:hypothetical protein
MMDALVEIHRVLYRGREDMDTEVYGQEEARTLKWDEQGKEVKRVVERWFEGDCREFEIICTGHSVNEEKIRTDEAEYDHPLAQVSSRDSLLTHFVLLHLVSTLYLPSITPSALVQHARGLTSGLKSRVLGEEGANDLEGFRRVSRPDGKGKEKAHELEGKNWSSSAASKEGEGNKSGWWKAWDVSADCREIGGMECYGQSISFYLFSRNPDSKQTAITSP